MKYVFYDVYVYSSAPKAAQGIINMLKRASGTEMLKGYFTDFLEAINDLLEKTNEKGRIAKLEMFHNSMVDSLDHKEHGRITIIQKGKQSPKEIARIYYIEVNNFWAKDLGKEHLEMFSFYEGKSKESESDEAGSIKKEEIIEKMVIDIINGVSVEKVADKYVVCANPDLRKKLIDGLKSIVEKGGQE